MKIRAFLEIDKDKLLKTVDDCDISIEDAVSREMGKVAESGIYLKDFERTNMPSFYYPRLNLAHLLTLNPSHRNFYIALTYHSNASSAYCCEEEEIAICGDDENGFAEEESLVEYVLDYSDIKIGKMCDTEEPYKENSIELIQDGVVYLVDYIMSDAGCSETCEHFNFNTLRVKRAYNNEQRNIFINAVKKAIENSEDGDETIQIEHFDVLEALERFSDEIEGFISDDITFEIVNQGDLRIDLDSFPVITFDILIPEFNIIIEVVAYHHIEWDYYIERIIKQ